MFDSRSKHRVRAMIKNVQNKHSTADGLKPTAFYLGLITLSIGFGFIVYWGFYKFLTAAFIGFTAITVGTKFNSGAPWKSYWRSFKSAMILVGALVGISSVVGVTLGAIGTVIYLISS